MAPRLHRVVETDAHEAPVYAPEEDALHFTTVHGNDFNATRPAGRGPDRAAVADVDGTNPANASEEKQMPEHDYPQMIAHVDLIEPVPRRIRAVLAGTVVLDTTGALYVWEWPYYPQYYIPLADVNAEVLVDEDHPEHLHRGTARRHGLRVGEVARFGVAHVYTDDALAGLAGTVRFDWAALDAWFEEDEQVFVHPRNPYVRVDAIRSTRRVRVELDGLVLAESASPVMVFETGLPTRYYLNRTEVNFEHLRHTDTVTSCPYKGVTSDYWSVVVGDTVHTDLAWAYDFPTRQLLPIAGLIAFYNEKVDIVLDGECLTRPKTHFFK